MLQDNWWSWHEDRQAAHGWMRQVWNAAYTLCDEDLDVHTEAYEGLTDGVLLGRLVVQVRPAGDTTLRLREGV